MFNTMGWLLVIAFGCLAVACDDASPTPAPSGSTTESLRDPRKPERDDAPPDSMSAEDVATIKERAAKGDARAQFELAVKYANGRGVTKDDAEAVVWFRRGAEQGHAECQVWLGFMYRSGRGVTRDEIESAEWYQRAAEQGNATAQNALGMIHAEGRGLPKDDAEAVRLFRLAAAQGNAAAENNLGYMHGKGRGVPRDDFEAVKWYLRSAERGYAQAQFNLARRYAEGRGVTKSTAEAAKWYSLAADQGDVEAQDALKALRAGRQSRDEDDTIEASKANAAVAPTSVNASDSSVMNDARMLIFDVPGLDLKTLSDVVERPKALERIRSHLLGKRLDAAWPADVQIREDQSGRVMWNAIITPRPVAQKGWASFATRIAPVELIGLTDDRLASRLAKHTPGGAVRIRGVVTRVHAGGGGILLDLKMGGPVELGEAAVEGTAPSDQKTYTSSVSAVSVRPLDSPPTRWSYTLVMRSDGRKSEMVLPDFGPNSPIQGRPYTSRNWGKSIISRHEYSKRYGDPESQVTIRNGMPADNNGIEVRSRPECIIRGETLDSDVAHRLAKLANGQNSPEQMLSRFGDAGFEDDKTRRIGAVVVRGSYLSTKYMRWDMAAGVRSEYNSMDVIVLDNVEIVDVAGMDVEGSVAWR